MERLDGPLADLVAAEREAMEALPDTREAAWAQVATAWQAQPPPPTSTPGGGAEATAASAGAGGVLKVVAAVVVSVGVAAGAWVATRPEAPVPVARVTAPEVRPAEEPGATPSPPEAPLLAEPPPAPAPAPVRESAPAVSKPQANAPGLAEELALIDAMRRDVAAGRYGKALSRAKEHRRVFASGSLTADRMDLEAAARCGNGDLDAGRRLADRKAKRWPRAPIGEHLQSLCKLNAR